MAGNKKEVCQRMNKEKEEVEYYGNENEINVKNYG